MEGYNASGTGMDSARGALSGFSEISKVGTNSSASSWSESWMVVLIINTSRSSDREDSGGGEGMNTLE
jgi:hypothetical protein